ncbi:STAS domain-containing protein [Streptomyces sp. DH12]|uniref:STAS domain-containing protein n=1 Tax=Streptomyces sp. DH12 TaxID=2857010 RepID=UPI001E5AE76C|nr:STAS domain-containing protein [Streptomyces sp. DH12]
MLRVIQRTGDRVTAALPADVDLHTTPRLCAVGDRIIDEGCRHLVLDASGTDHLDSTGISVFIAWYKRLSALGGSLTLTEVDERHLAVLTRLGLTSIMTIIGVSTTDNPGA